MSEEEAAPVPEVMIRFGDGCGFYTNPSNNEEFMVLVFTESKSVAQQAYVEVEIFNENANEWRPMKWDKNGTPTEKRHPFQEGFGALRMNTTWRYTFGKLTPWGEIVSDPTYVGARVRAKNKDNGEAEADKEATTTIFKV